MLNSTSLTNIRATDESLATGTEVTQDMTDCFNNGNVQSKVIAENKNSGDSSAATPLTPSLSTLPTSNDCNLLII